MIYKIYSLNLIDMLDDSSLVCYSFDGKYALLRSENDLVGYLEKSQENELSALMNLPLWTQPCVNC